VAGLDRFNEAVDFQSDLTGKLRLTLQEVTAESS